MSQSRKDVKKSDKYPAFAGSFSSALEKKPKPQEYIKQWWVNTVG